jgi:hypothetical protein
MSDGRLLAIACIVLFAQWVSFKLGQRHERIRRRLSRGGGTYSVDIRSAYPATLNSDYGKKK